MESVHIKLIATFLLCCNAVVRGLVFKPAIFVFGDSLADPGNNNYIPATIAKSDFPYNGIDFPGGATGRFCNGRTVVDVVCDLVGVPYPPPYLAPNTIAGMGIVQGVSYASAAGGILDGTGANFIQRLGMNQQLAYFQNTLAQLQQQVGAAQTSTILGTSICAIVIGSNDFINNYLLPDASAKAQYPDTKQYNLYLLQTLNQQLTTLYNNGFRNFVVAAVGPLGCIPNQLAIAKTPTCVQSTNDQVVDYNSGLKKMLGQLTSSLQGSKFLYANVYDAVNSLVNEPANFGFTTTNMGCCGAGLYKGEVPCLPLLTPCQDRKQHVFWDPYHPTEAANVILARKIYSGTTDQISPMNVQQLLKSL